MIESSYRNVLASHFDVAIGRSPFPASPTLVSEVASSVAHISSRFRSTINAHTTFHGSRRSYRNSITGRHPGWTSPRSRPQTEACERGPHLRAGGVILPPSTQQGFVSTSCRRIATNRADPSLISSVMAGHINTASEHSVVACLQRFPAIPSTNKCCTRCCFLSIQKSKNICL